MEEADIKNDAVLLTFANVMQLAQETAAEAEKTKRKGNKRPRQYIGNSQRSLCCFAEKRQKIKAEGRQAFISSWLILQNVDKSSEPEPHETVACLVS